MLTKNIDVEVDASTWGSKSVPTFLTSGIGIQQVNLNAAFFTLGNLTMPNAISIASPARFWAWLRYYLAPGASSDFKIIMPFSELDPHQKGILSDDFGVAISTQWLFDRLGSFKQIVDGRQFVRQFPDLLAEVSASKAKVGSTKIPDFVIEDSSGKWHVLECKGTQSGPMFRDSFLKRAVQQKNAIRITGAMQGQRLAAGLAISNVENAQRTHLKIVDPEADPLLSLGENQRQRASRVSSRLAMARAMGIIGLNEAAVELSFPQDFNTKDVSPFSTHSERIRNRRSRSERVEDAFSQIKATSLRKFSAASESYSGRVASFEFPEGSGDLSGAKVQIRQGLSTEVWSGLKKSGISDLEIFEDKLEQLGEKVVIEADEDRVSLTYGHTFFADIKITRR